MRFVQSLVMLALAACGPAAADTVYTHANGYTLDDAGRVQRFATLVVADDGRILARLADGATPPAGKVIDLKGRTMLPGLIDAHGHIMSLGRQALAVDLTGTTSLDAALAEVKRQAGKGSWVRGGGWNQELWKLGRFPTAVELDKAVGDRPAWLKRVDGHAGWANNRALALAGITAATPDPEGGRIERDAGGKPTGVLVDAAMALIDSKAPPPTAREEDAAFAKAQQIIASVGLTGVHDAGIDKPTWERYRRAAAAGKLTTRIYAMAFGPENLAAVAPSGPIPWGYGDRLALMAMKLQQDGALGSRGAWLRQPYSDAPGQTGLRFHEEGKLRRMVLDATAKGFQVNVHAIGDAANGAVLGAFATVPEVRRQALRLRVEHAQIVSPEDLPRFARLGVIASMQPTHATSDKAMAESRLGEKRLAGAYAWKTILNSGARLAGGSDFPVESPNPFFGLHAAVTRQDHDNQPPGGWRPQEALSLPQALAMFTTGAAYAGHAETRVGTLDPGKWADFILLDRDPFAIPATELWKVRVGETWLAGRRVFKR
jgi:predicted amidohydrolase YtcJ